MVQIRDPATGRSITVERRPIRVAANIAGAADVAARQAQLDAEGGVSTFTGLYEGDRRVRARIVTGKWGLSWLVDGDDAAKFGRKWLPYGLDSKVQKALGLRERPELAPALAQLQSRRVAVVRAGCEWGSDARLKFTTTKDA